MRGCLVNHSFFQEARITEENSSFTHLLMPLFYNSCKEWFGFGLGFFSNFFLFFIGWLLFNMFLNKAACIFLHGIFLRDLISGHKKTASNLT